jgi:hypothetical protein
MLNHKQEKNDRESEERADYFENRGLGECHAVDEGHRGVV